VKYACIREHRREYAISIMCRGLEVSRAGYYASLRRQPAKRKIARERLRMHVLGAFRVSRQRYGSPRIWRELRAQQIAGGRRQVGEIMRESGLRAQPRRRYLVTTDSAHGYGVARNLLKREFSAQEANQVWVADITYLNTLEGQLYLAVVIDLWSRRVVGWNLQATMELSLASQALERAIWQRRPGVGLVHHSDRGVHYTAPNYRVLLERHGIVSSMSRKGDCWDNAVAESFFATLKKELPESRKWRTRDQARSDVFEFIEVWYNRQRRHSTLGYRSPEEYERIASVTPTAA
jgi:putative transposase